MTPHYDIVIVGSGAGGGTIARALANSPARILILERGGHVPQEDENWNPEVVWQQLRYRTTERWRNGEGREFLPYTHYGVGGNTKFWGSVLYRLRREDFHEMEHVDGVSPAWPIDYETLEPFYEQAERMYHVHGQAGLDPTEPTRGPFPHAPVPHSEEMASIVAGLQRLDLHPSPLPLGLIRPGEEGGCELCDTCNSFPCKIHAKSDAEVCGVRPALEHTNVELWTNAFARRLITDPSGCRIQAVDVEKDGQTVRVGASLFIASCGAVNSAALLLRSANDAHPNGLANSSGLVGRRYMAHLVTMLEMVIPFRKNKTRFQKTVAINDFYLKRDDTKYPLGHIQSQGRTHGIMAKGVGDVHIPHIPLWMYTQWVSWGFDWLAMSEDLPLPENRVTLTSGGDIQLQYRPSNLRTHRLLVERTIGALRKVGLRRPFLHNPGVLNTTHQCGTMCFGTDPKSSVLDPFCRSHDVENLFVVDASFFPSSAAVNPGLTIAAQALRVADHIKATHLD